MISLCLLCVMKQCDLNYLSLELVRLEITFYTYFFYQKCKKKSPVTMPGTPDCLLLEQGTQAQ